MTWVAAAVAGTAVLGYVGSQQAANKQVGAANHATDVQQAIYDQSFQAGAPYRQAGEMATGRLNDLLGISGNTGADGYGWLTHTFNANDYLANQDPGYEFQRQQGQQALQNSQAAKDGALSGAALKGLMSWNQDYAKAGYQNAFDRFTTNQNNIYSRLGNLATLGQNSAANTGSTGASFANGLSGTITGAGNAAASGTIGGVNAINSAVNNGMGYYQLNSLLNKGSGIDASGAGSLYAGGGANGSLNGVTGIYGD